MHNNMHNNVHNNTHNITRVIPMTNAEVARQSVGKASFATISKWGRVVAVCA